MLRILSTDTYTSQGNGLSEGYQCSIRAPFHDRRSGYAKLREEGYAASDAWRVAGIFARTHVEIEAGRLAFLMIADDDPDLSWLKQSDSQMGRGFQASAKKELERASSDGCWGIASYARLSESEPWEQADSVWGFIGDDCLGSSGYEPDILQAGLEKLETLEDSACPTCGHSRKAR